MRNLLYFCHQPPVEVVVIRVKNEDSELLHRRDVIKIRYFVKLEKYTLDATFIPENAGGAFPSKLLVSRTRHESLFVDFDAAADSDAWHDMRFDIDRSR